MTIPIAPHITAFLRERLPVERRASEHTCDSYAFAFLDPPYGKGLGEMALRALAGGGWMADGSVAVIEERAGQPIVLPGGVESFDARTYGDTAITFASFTGRG